MGDFEWKTPSRRRGSRILSLLPTEVYLEIFAYLEPSEKDNVVDCKHIFSNLALVCRFFCAHAISRVYRSIEFSGRDASSGAPGFCRLLLRGTNSTVQNHASDARFPLHVAQSVRECTFRNWIGIPSAAAFLKSYCKAVGQMPNIQCFRLESTPSHYHSSRQSPDLKRRRRHRAFGRTWRNCRSARAPWTRISLRRISRMCLRSPCATSNI
ncbi:hypothetical protein B0H17DRAFT_2648 [Mycena rosella]|uniref:F-box domain-containing protein n=1 Tax=Mycena rosella TaxID=1033263 RepID=A0AAD7MCB3_MYCRO|nr:hypothetical protein B0H17DRAFT_2648 [Mycena rosella]